MTFKQYTCHLCSKQADTEGKLNRHLKTHTKPFHCETCEQGFALRSDLSRHIKSRHRAGNEQYRCHFEHCAFKSNRKDNLGKHRRKAHDSKRLSRSVEKGDNTRSSQQQSEVLSTPQLYSTSIFMQVAASGDFNRLKDFLDAGLTVETKTDDECTALHCAARAGQVEIVRYLLQSGANAIVRNQGGRSPIHEAVLSKNPETLDCLLRSITQEELYCLGPDLELSCIQSGSFEIVDVYLARLGSEFTDRDGSEKLSLAIRAGHHSLVATLLADPDINGNDRISKRQNSYAPIHVAACYGQTKVLETLIACGQIDITLGTHRSRQAIHIAASYGHTAIVEQFIGHPSVDVNQQDHDGTTPLHLAASNGHIMVVKQLICLSGVDFDCQDKKGATPLHYAAASGRWEMISFLLRCWDLVNDGQCLPPHDSSIPVSFAKEDLIRRLLKYPGFAGPNQELARGKTLLEVAAAKGDCEAIKVLLAHEDIDVNIFREWIMSPLMAAAYHGKLEAVRLLLQHKDIDVNQMARNYWKRTALECAKYHKHHDIANLLLSHGAIDYWPDTPPTVPTTALIDKPQNTTLQPYHESNYDQFDDDMDDAPIEAWEEFWGMQEGVAE